MQVILKNDWYNHFGRFKKSSVPQEIPNSLKELLPSTAIIIEKNTIVEREPDIRDLYKNSHIEQAQNELLKADEERVASDAYAQALESADEPVEEKRKPGRPKKDS